MKIRNFIKINVMVSLFAFLSACSQDDISTDKNVAPEKTVITERQVTQEQALNFSEQAFKAILENESEQLGESDLKLKADSVKVINKKVEKVYTDDGKVALYIINFGNNEGFMVISGDKESSSIVLSYNSKGSLNYSTLDKTSTVALWLEAKRQEISKKLNSGKNSDNEESYLIWDGFNTKTKEESKLKLLTTENFKYNTEKTTRDNNYSCLKPRKAIASNTWGQGQGYNADAKNGALIGCPAVAVGIICRYFTFPTGANFDYANMPRRLYNVTTSNPISRMFRTIADNIPNYQWGKNPGEGSGATLMDIKTGLINLGYKRADFIEYNLDSAYENMKNYGPILLAGFSGSGSGHIWDADGYVKYSFQICKNNQIIVRTQELLFMNWGWNGMGNGWVDQNEWKPNIGNAEPFDYRYLYINVYPVK